jgi:hypothetical protein
MREQGASSRLPASRTPGARIVAKPLQSLPGSPSQPRRRIPRAEPPAIRIVQRSALTLADQRERHPQRNDASVERAHTRKPHPRCCRNRVATPTQMGYLINVTNMMTAVGNRRRMDRSSLVLAALAAAGGNAAFTPVQVQKLLFLIDREAGRLVGGPHFDFLPYDYGPFDRAVMIPLTSSRSEDWCTRAWAGTASTRSHPMVTTKGVNISTTLSPQPKRISGKPRSGCAASVSINSSPQSTAHIRTCE